MDAPRRRRGVSILLAGVIVVLAAVVYAFNPAGGGWFPPCLLYKATHLYCPGCGATRAMHALLHGRLIEAAGYNVFATILLPLVAIGVIAQAACPGILPRRTLPVAVGWAIAGVAVVFTILRNLPMPPFEVLAP